MKGFTNGFLTVFKPVNDMKGKQIEADKEALKWLKANAK